MTMGWTPTGYLRSTFNSLFEMQFFLSDEYRSDDYSFNSLFEMHADLHGS